MGSKLPEQAATAGELVANLQPAEGAQRAIERLDVATGRPSSCSSSADPTAV
jgi:hypothetical protein